MNYENPHQHSLIEQVRAINPEVASAFVLRAYSWPTAVLERIAYYVEIGAEITPGIQYALSQLHKKPPSKDAMIDFIQEQINNCSRHAQTRKNQEVVLANTGIHVVDLLDPFKWPATSAYSRQNLICDLASIAQSSGRNATVMFGNLMSAQNDYFSRVIIDLNATMMKIQKPRSGRWF